MAISYSIDPSLDVVRVTCIGAVTAAELEAHWRSVLVDDDVLRCRRMLVDLRPSRPTLTTAEVASLISSVVGPAVAGHDLRIALVAFGPAQTGLCRQYHVLLQSHDCEATFAEPSMALEWLRRGPVPESAGA